AQFSKATYIGDRIVDGFALGRRPRHRRLLFVVLLLLLLWFGRRGRWAADLHRRSCTKIGGRRHRGDVTRIEQVRASACSTGTRRRYIDDDWNGRRQRRLDHDTHCRIESARRIELHEENRRTT